MTVMTLIGRRRGALFGAGREAAAGAVGLARRRPRGPFSVASRRRKVDAAGRTGARGEPSKKIKKKLNNIR